MLKKLLSKPRRWAILVLAAVVGLSATAYADLVHLYDLYEDHDDSDCSAAKEVVPIGLVAGLVVSPIPACRQDRLQQPRFSGCPASLRCSG